jgi:hypothetical protein
MPQLLFMPQGISLIFLYNLYKQRTFKQLCPNYAPIIPNIMPQRIILIFFKILLEPL